ncbi:MAG: hypothetical protein ABH817_01355 [archaeon]
MNEVICTFKTDDGLICSECLHRINHLESNCSKISIPKVKTNTYIITCEARCKLLKDILIEKMLK